ncbi:hypothetical protein SDC9_168634 [bioreactor metagenome]|uniref:Uncharacterized protein n=1 Tax=bioreactor metagenome TaxID=1076179 RepID=A0A645G3N5_9ZZZZ
MALGVRYVNFVAVILYEPATMSGIVYFPSGFVKSCATGLSLTSNILTVAPSIGVPPEVTVPVTMPAADAVLAVSCKFSVTSSVPVIGNCTLAFRVY